MPVDSIKNLAKKAKLSKKQVEEIWEKAKKAAEKTYDKEEKAFWPVVMSIAKKMLGEDGEGTPSTTTANLAYAYKYVADESKSVMPTVKTKRGRKPSNVTVVEVKPIKNNKDYDSRVSAIVRRINNPDKENKLFGSFMAYYMYPSLSSSDSKELDFDQIFDENFSKTITAIEKYLGMIDSYISKIK